MTDEQAEILRDVRDSLVELANVAKGAPQPTRAVLNAQIFLLVQKVRFLLGEEAKPEGGEK
jgi:hypothetical protein